MKRTPKLMALGCLVLLATACTKDVFNEQDALEAQKELLELKYEKEMELETLRQQGYTALEQLRNSFALQQIRVTDSLNRANEKALRTQDYFVPVIDVTTGQPVVDADVIVTAEGKAYQVKTDTKGIAYFPSLVLFPQTLFLISKDGYASTAVSANYIRNAASFPVRLWANSNNRNELRGSVLAETDLTNAVVDTLGEKVLVTLSTTIPSSGTMPSYRVVYSAYTDEKGAYSIKVPDAPNDYMLELYPYYGTQTLFINKAEQDPGNVFFAALARRVTLKATYQSPYNAPIASIPNVTTRAYIRSEPDSLGNVMYHNVRFYIPGLNTYPYYYYYGDYVQLADKDAGSYEVIRTSFTNSITNESIYAYKANDTIMFEMVDITGKIMMQAPRFMAVTNEYKQLTYLNTGTNPDGTAATGRIALARYPAGTDNSGGELLPGAKGIFFKSMDTELLNRLYNLDNNTSLNSYRFQPNALFNFSVIPDLRNGNTLTRNIFYGSAAQREYNVY